MIVREVPLTPQYDSAVIVWQVPSTPQYDSDGLRSPFNPPMWYCCDGLRGPFKPSIWCDGLRGPFKPSIWLCCEHFNFLSFHGAALKSNDRSIFLRFSFFNNKLLGTCILLFSAFNYSLIYFSLKIYYITILNDSERPKYLNNEEKKCRLC